jgi:hypothetical protein
LTVEQLDAQVRKNFGELDGIVARNAREAIAVVNSRTSNVRVGIALHRLQANPRKGK